MADSHSSTRNAQRARRADHVGIGLAGLCALHCIATIMIVSGLGIGGHFLLAPEIHTIGLALATMIAAFALGWGAFRHGTRMPFVIAFTGLFMMGAALASPHGVQEATLTIIGVVLVSIGHFMNLRAGHSL